MKIEVFYKTKNYVLEYKEIIGVKDIISVIKQQNKIKKSKKLLLCNEDRNFEEEDKIGEIHDQEFFYIFDISDAQKPKFKKPKKEDIAEMIRKCTGAKEKLETKYIYIKFFYLTQVYLFICFDLIISVYLFFLGILGERISVIAEELLVIIIYFIFVSFFSVICITLIF